MWKHFNGKRWAVIGAALICLALGGCRTRVVSAPERADTVLLAARVPEIEPTPEPTPGPTPPPPPPEPEETAPPEESPTENAPQEETAEPLTENAQDAEAAESAELSRPETVTGLDAAGQALLEEQTETDITVTYDPNGGDSPVWRATVHPGEAYGVQPECVRRGYAPDGWWTAAEGGEQIFPSTTVTAREAHTLYAHWLIREAAAVTFDGNGGRVKSKEAKLNLSDGDAFGTLPVPLREGFTFLGWYTAPEDGAEITAESVFTGEADLTLYAHWEYDPFAFWTFTLQNRTQQVYMCQQASFYFELAQENMTQAYCGLISDTGSLNIAENRSESAVTDDWVLGKKPRAVIKCAGGMDEAPALKLTLRERFPEQEIVIVTGDALGGGASGLYARLALAKHFYGDWYADVDLSAVAAELGVSNIPISF